MVFFYCTRARQTALKSSPDGLISYFLLHFKVSGRCQERLEIHLDNISYYIGARQAGLKLEPRDSDRVFRIMFFSVF